MNQYPEKTCDISRLVRHPKLVASALAGKKTEQRRDGVYAYPGEEFALDDVTFVMTGLTQQKLGDMSDTDAQAEGYPSFAMYKSLILSMHQDMQWQDSALVWVHCFERKN